MDPIPKTDEPIPLRSKHTASFATLLSQLNISLLVTTYQAGKLVLLRAEGDRVNTHFRNLPRPMGMAGDATRLAVGTIREIRQYRNLPQVCRRMEPAGRHDACYLLRSLHTTGDINIHEMAWVSAAPSQEEALKDEGELWFVNTRFSCLCTLNAIHNFVPRWRPPFISGLAPEDRCHLNGLGVAADNQGRLSVRFVTALSETDTQQGWRQHKKDGGVVMEVPSGKVLARGLCMPHSPRWVHDRLWVLESGKGSIGIVELSTGRYQSLAELPGFTRGSTFTAPLRSSACRKCGKVLFSAASRSLNGRWQNATAEFGSSMSATGKRWHSCVLKRQCRRCSRFRCWRAFATPK